MAGAFSGHLIDSHYSSLSRAAQFSAPFGVRTSGAMSFNPQMHGTPADASYSEYPSMMDLSEANAVKISQLQAKLNQKLGPEFLSQRPGPSGGPKLTYAEGWKLINLANDVFGFNGWSSSVVSLTTDFVDFNEETRRYNVGVTAIIRVTLRDGVYHEDIGYGMLENSKGKGAALDKCKKEAVTDGLKRALRNFGNLLGNCLYDKSYTNEVVKIKVPQPKFDKSELHRRPEFAETKPEAGPSSHHEPTTVDSKANILPAELLNPVKENQQQQPMTSVPPYMRQDSRTTPSAGPSRLNGSTPLGKGKEKEGTNGNGLPTPLKTPGAPAQHPRPRASERRAALPNTRNQEKRVAFAESEATALDEKIPKMELILSPKQNESFSYSDDDEFLSGFDLADIDLGRPIAFEENVGILSRDPSFDVMESEQIHVQPPLESKPTLLLPPPMSRQQFLQQQIESNTSRSTEASIPHPAGGRNPPAMSGTSATNSAGPQDMRPTEISPGLQTNSKATLKSRMDKRTILGDLAQRNRASTSEEANVPRPSSSSMGGFHFPAGVSHSRQVAGSSPTDHKNTNHGMKRTFGDMQASTSRTASVGMGLHSASVRQSGTAGAHEQRQESFGNVDVGGDVKRLRR